MAEKKKPAKKKKVRRTTSKDIPGNGLAKKAGKAIESRNKKMKKMLEDL